MELAALALSAILSVLYKRFVGAKRAPERREVSPPPPHHEVIFFLNFTYNLNTYQQCVFKKKKNSTNKKSTDRAK